VKKPKVRFIKTKDRFVFMTFVKFHMNKAQFDESQIRYLVGIWRREPERDGSAKVCKHLVEDKVYQI